MTRRSNLHLGSIALWTAFAGALPAQYTCTTLSPLDDAKYALMAPVEIKFTKHPYDVQEYSVFAYPDGGVDPQHSPVTKRFRNADVTEFSTIFQINDPRTYNVRVWVGSALVGCDPPSGRNNRFTVLPDPSAVPTPCPTPPTNLLATPALKLDSHSIGGSASVADRAISLEPMTIKNWGSEPLVIYDIKPYGCAPELIVSPVGFVPCTVIPPRGSLSLPMVARGDFEELAKYWSVSVSFLVICNDPDSPSYSGELSNEKECYATRVHVSVGVTLESLGLAPRREPARYVPPLPCGVPTPTPPTAGAKTLPKR